MKAYESIKSDRLETVCLSLTLDTRKREQSLPVAVRINCNRRTIYYRTGLRCTIDEWEKLCRATGKGASAQGSIWKTKESQIEIYEKVKSAVLELQRNETFSLEKIKSKLTGRSVITFSDVWEDVISQRRLGTAEAYRIAYNSFTKYIGKKISFDRICPEIVRKWEEKMREDEISNTTCGMYMRAMRVVANECIKAGYINQQQYPFGKSEDRVKIKKGRVRKDDYLDVATIKKIMEFTPIEKWSPGYSDAVMESINLWLFSYLGNGMNLADIAMITYDKHYFNSGGTELCFVRKKTQETTDEDVEIIVPIIDELKNILSKYGAKPELDKRIFPQILGGVTDEIEIKKIIAQTNSNIRDRLRVVCNHLGIERSPSMTYARHSFATNLAHAGVSERYISDAMGHSLKNVTQGYIGLFSPEKRRLFNQMLIQE